MELETHVVTGAFGYSGRYITHRLLDAGHDVVTLTNSNASDPFDGRVSRSPLDFRNPGSLATALEGAAVLYNTYWVRFDHRDFNHREAVANTLKLFEAASEAGVRRIVHVSITNPAAESDLSYFGCKAAL